MKYQFDLQNLGCANCANKIESKLNKSASIKHAVINFPTKKLTLDHEGSNIEALAEKVQAIASSIEYGIVVTINKKTEIGQGRGSKFISDKKNGHTHNHGKEKENGFDQSRLITIILGTVIGSLGVLLPINSVLSIVIFLCGYLIISYPILLISVRNLFHGNLFDENFLMSIATIGAIAIGEYLEALAVILLYQIGEYLQDLAVDRSRKNISLAMDLKASHANLQTSDGITSVPPEEVSIGDIILIKPNEKIPLDGIVQEGSSYIDTSSLTGESVPRNVKEGDEVLSGCINGNSTLLMEVTKEYSDSTVAKILDLVENASSRKANVENFITKFARVYTPLVVAAALLLALLPPIVTGSWDFAPWIYKACSFLVVSCPCALVISVPLGFFGGIGNASKNGIIVKGSNYLDALSEAHTVVFDKTGTLTKGVFHVTKVLTSESMDEETVLRNAAYAESFSNHPIAKSITAKYLKSIDTSLVKHYEEIAGYGIRAIVEGRSLLLGNQKLMTDQDIRMPDLSNEGSGSVVHLAMDGTYAGSIYISDEIKSDSKYAVNTLNQQGMKTILLTGDNESNANYTAKEIGVNVVYSNLLPSDKVSKLEEVMEHLDKKHKVLFVGDGINDAPVLARSDVGVAMGGIGSDAAIEAADVILMTDEPSKLVHAISIAKQTRRIVTQNIVFSLGIKLLILVLVTLGFGTLWLAIFADVGVSLIAIVNSLRALRWKGEYKNEITASNLTAATLEQ